MIALLAAAAAVLLSVLVVAARQGVVAALATRAAVAPLRVRALGGRAQRARRAVAARWVAHAVVGYLLVAARAVGIAVPVPAAVAAALALMHWSGRIGPGGGWVVWGIGYAAVAGAAAALVLVLYALALPEARRARLRVQPQLARLLPFDLRTFRPGGCEAQFAALADSARKLRQGDQQCSLDLLAAESARVLGRAIELEPEELRARVAYQLALWQVGQGAGDGLDPLAHREAMAAIDAQLAHLEQDLADGVGEHRARAFWYTVILRTLRHRAGPQALAGVVEGKPLPPLPPAVLELVQPVAAVTDLTVFEDRDRVGGPDLS